MCQKRAGGQLARLPNQVSWLVITESTKGEGKTWVHKCNTPLKIASVAMSHRDEFSLWASVPSGQMDVPYCPECETVPVKGSIHDGSWTLEGWVDTPPQVAAPSI